MQPSVTMVMLYADRPQFLAQALACFRTQTYQNKWLLIYNNGRDPLDLGLFPNEALVQDHGYPGRSIGVLRNTANGFAKTDILAHLDVDDWSQPNRVTEQVALLQASGANCVGMNKMLFWRDPAFRFANPGDPSTTAFPGEAWLYSNPRPNYALGTSLCYWRKTWECSPFTDGPKPNGTSEYHHWFALNSGVRVHGVTSFGGDISLPPSVVPPEHDGYAPRMIARIHGGNTGQYDLEKLIAGGSREWKRAANWDTRVAEILK